MDDIPGLITVEAVAVAIAGLGTVALGMASFTASKAVTEENTGSWNALTTTSIGEASIVVGAGAEVEGNVAPATLSLEFSVGSGVLDRVRVLLIGLRGLGHLIDAVLLGVLVGAPVLAHDATVAERALGPYGLRLPGLRVRVRDVARGDDLAMSNNHD